MFFAFDYIPDQCKTQEIRDIVVSFYPFLIVYCPDNYKTQRMCHKAVDDALAALKFFSDQFLTSKMIKNLCTVLYANDDCTQISVLFCTMILVRMMLIVLFLSDFWLGIVNFKNAKHLRK